MKVLLYLVALVCMAGLAQCIVCPPSFCSTVNCVNSPTQDGCAKNGQVYDQHGSFCGCCPTCISYIPVGGNCLQIRGLPQSSVCTPGSHCDNGICTN